MKIDNSIAIMQSQNLDLKLEDKNDILLKEQTDKFEAFIIKQVLDISLKEENPLYPKDAGDKIYNSMYHEALSDTLSGKFGYSQLLFNFLKENR